MHFHLHVKVCYSCPILTKTEKSQKIYVKIPNLKFHENLSSGSSVVPSPFTNTYSRLCPKGWMLTNPQVKVTAWKSVPVTPMTPTEQHSMITLVSQHYAVWEKKVYHPSKTSGLD
jgi:hypothetical protein